MHIPYVIPQQKKLSHQCDQDNLWTRAIGLLPSVVYIQRLTLACVGKNTA